jgi:hypothetical protein
MHKYDGEWGKRVLGISKFNLICDICGIELSKGSPCTAESFGVDSQSCIPWETGLLKIEGPKY